MPEGTNTATGGNPAIPIEQNDRDRAKALWDFMQAQGPLVGVEGGKAIGREMLRLFSIHRHTAKIPEGWQLAPIEPPRSMILRGASVSLCPYTEVAAIYSAMLAAVPAPPAPPIAKEPEPDRRLNLAIALFEAAYGMTLRAWSDQTRDFWLARADQAMEPAISRKDALAEFRKAAQGHGRAGTADWPGGPYMAMDDAADVYAKLKVGPA